MLADKISGNVNDPMVARWVDVSLTVTQKDVTHLQVLLQEIRAQAMLQEMDMYGESNFEIAERQMRSILSTVADDNPEVNYVVLSIPHHAGAVEMALSAVVLTKDSRIRDIASATLSELTACIAEQRKWLDDHQP